MNWNLKRKICLITIKLLIANKDSIQHDTYIDAIVNHVVDGESFVDVDAEFEIFQKLLKNIDVKILNKKIKDIYSKEGVYFYQHLKKTLLYLKKF